MGSPTKRTSPVGEEPERSCLATRTFEVGPPLRDEVVEVGRGEHGGHAGHLRGGVGRHIGDATAGGVAADECGVQGAGQRDVVDEAPTAGEEAGVLVPCDPLADEASAGDRAGHDRDPTSAARRAASMIPW